MFLDLIMTNPYPSQECSLPLSQLLRHGGAGRDLRNKNHKFASKVVYWECNAPSKPPIIFV